MSKRKYGDQNGKNPAEPLELYIARRQKEAQERQTSGGEADWREVDPNVIAGLVDAVTAAGGAVLFGKDRSRYVYQITIFAEKAKMTQYFQPDDQFEEMIAWMEEMTVAMNELANKL